MNEAQEACSSDNQMVQYHALGLLHHLRKRDPLAIEKLVSKLARSGLKSPLAYTLLIRIAAQLLADDEDRSALFDFIESCLRNKNEMVRSPMSRGGIVVNVMLRRWFTRRRRQL